MKKQTPSQTVGPFYAIALTNRTMNVLVNESTQGQRIRIEGQVFDGDGQPIPDVMVEIWQANAYGRYNHPEDKQEKPFDAAFTGWGRSGTDENCFYSFETIKPGSVPGADDTVQAPHCNVTVFARGMLVHAYTRLYFADDYVRLDRYVLLAKLRRRLRRPERRYAPVDLPRMDCVGRPPLGLGAIGSPRAALVAPLPETRPPAFAGVRWATWGAAGPGSIPANIMLPRCGH